jgi:acyl carrier protein
MEKFKEKLVDIFEVSSISDSDVIKDFDSWDSLTLLSLIAVVDAEYKIQINAKLFEEVITIGDLLEYISNYKNK